MLFSQIHDLEKKVDFFRLQDRTHFSFDSFGYWQSFVYCLWIHWRNTLVVALMSISLCLGFETFAQVLMMQYIHLTKEYGWNSDYEEYVWTSDYEEYKHLPHEMRVFY